ncbi:hypothetical protein CUMW_266870 [Citrus unshiu]|uniref:Ubiquitin-like protease family profile domain-containing protein n=1 Tax=Citrus unshiu TaxID=55188 RepID=A0A2H5QW08_CITUN|nr:hypothetical protein CUMW_266870 [Citrus unshiu]
MDQRLRNTYFGGVHRKINVNQFDAVFKELKFEEMDDMDALKIALFYFADRAWIYEVIGGLPSTWVVKTRNKIPCILQWKPMASSRINFAEGDVLQNLEPNSRESCRKYWLSVKDYLPSIPDWVHKAPDDYRVYTDVGNENLSTPTLLYSFYGDVSGESVQVFTEVPPGVSKFGRAYIPSYVYNSPYMIPPVRRGQNVRPLPRPQIMGHAIDMSTSVDDSSLFAEFDRWFTGDSRVRQRVQHPRSFFQIILSTTSMGWLGDGHIHEYLHLISEKQRQYPNALLQRVTHTDTFFWVFLNQLWNNVDCAVDSLVFDDCLNSYLCGRQHTMSKSMTDVDILLIPVNLDGAHWLLERVDIRKNKVWIYDSLLTFCDDKRYKLKFKPLEVIFPRWLEYVGFYNIRLE